MSVEKFAGKPHPFVPLEKGLFARTPERETCARCGENAGSKQHYNRFSVWHTEETAKRDRR